MEELAKRLLSLSDKDLSKAINHWGEYDPEILKATIAEGCSPSWPTSICGIWSDVWSDPNAAYTLLNKLGVRKCGNGFRENQTDGECDVIFENIRGEKFRLNGNYYDNKCFVPVVRWALENYLKWAKR